MKYISYLYQGKKAYGHVDGDKVSDFTTISGAPASLSAAIAQGKLAELKAPANIELADIEFLPLVDAPSKIFCVGHNYEDHRKETGRAKVEYPSIFTRFADTLNAHRGQIIMPKVSTSLDYEGELAVIIGKGGRYIPKEDAHNHILGYACANDASVRDWQWHTQQFTPGKNFPTTAPIGPYLVSPDEIKDFADIDISTRLNGEIVQQAKLGDLIFTIDVIINYLSSFTPLNAGDVILSGTPGGVGAKRNPPLWMKSGDVVEVEISQIGKLVNQIGVEV